MLGGVPKPQLSLTHPLAIDPPICSNAANTILMAMSQAPLPQQPLLVMISANGVLNDAPRDYPWALTPLYRWLLRGIYDDKRAMEAALVRAKPPGGYVTIRPSILSDGASKGLEVIRQGTTEQPVFGYGISREDVGLWMYENLVKVQDRSAFEGVGINITYQTRQLC